MIQPEILELLACPVCRGGLTEADGRLTCRGCGRQYPVQEGIPVLLPDAAQEAPRA